MASNSLVPTIRSTQTRLSGGVVCLACYGPVMSHWPDFEAVVLAILDAAETWRDRLAGGALGAEGADAAIPNAVLPMNLRA